MFREINQKFSSNKRIFLLFLAVVVILLIVGGFFLYKGIKKPEPEWKKIIQDNDYVEDKDYIITETDNEKIVENKEEGLVIKGPADWSVVKEDISVSIVSPEVKFDENGALIFSSIKEGGGCGVDIQIMKCKKVDPEITTSAEDLINMINLINTDEEFREKLENYEPKTEVISLSGYEGIKDTYIKDNNIRMIEIQIPLGQSTIYMFSSGLIMNQKCVEDFNKIMDTVSINK